jgi:hypothetical protein
MDGARRRRIRIQAGARATGDIAGENRRDALVASTGLRAQALAKKLGEPAEL